jgi:SAM-dependent methyltransferase
MYAIFAEAGLGEEVFNPRQHLSCELVELYVLRLAVQLVETLGLAPALAEGCAPDELLALRGFQPGFRAPLGWLLERLAVAGLLVREGGAKQARYRLSAPLPEPDLAAARAEGLASDPSYAPTYAMLDEAAAAYPKVAAGETSGERALFQKLSLWVAYFSNSNGYYALNNRVGAAATAARLPLAGGNVLEVGAGLGSATEALLDRLAGRGCDLAAYRATEPVLAFRRRAERNLTAAYRDVPLAFAALDVNQPWAAQGVAPGSCDLVWGVNVFHLARRLDAVLAEARTALAPGGWLVIGEGMRPAAGRVVGAEFPFQLLDSFLDVELDPVRRPTPGFLTADQWCRALAAAGFSTIALALDVARLLEIYPGFFAAAVCGRR